MTTSTRSPDGVVVHRPVRAHPRPPPAGELVVAAPPVVGWTAAGVAGWLQYLVPLPAAAGRWRSCSPSPAPAPPGWWRW